MTLCGSHANKVSKGREGEQKRGEDMEEPNYIPYYKEAAPLALLFQEYPFTVLDHETDGAHLRFQHWIDKVVNGLYVAISQDRSSQWIAGNPCEDWFSSDVPDAERQSKDSANTCDRSTQCYSHSVQCKERVGVAQITLVAHIGGASLCKKFVHQGDKKVMYDSAHQMKRIFQNLECAKATRILSSFLNGHPLVEMTQASVAALKRQLCPNGLQAGTFAADCIRSRDTDLLWISDQQVSVRKEILARLLPQTWYMSVATAYDRLVPSERRGERPAFNRSEELCWPPPDDVCALLSKEVIEAALVYDQPLYLEEQVLYSLCVMQACADRIRLYEACTQRARETMRFAEIDRFIEVAASLARGSVCYWAKGDEAQPATMDTSRALVAAKQLFANSSEQATSYAKSVRAQAVDEAFNLIGVVSKAEKRPPHLSVFAKELCAVHAERRVRQYFCVDADSDQAPVAGNLSEQPWSVMRRVSAMSPVAGALCHAAAISEGFLGRQIEKELAALEELPLLPSFASFRVDWEGRHDEYTLSLTGEMVFPRRCNRVVCSALMNSKNGSRFRSLKTERTLSHVADEYYQSVSTIPVFHTDDSSNLLKSGRNFIGGFVRARFYCDDQLLTQHVVYLEGEIRLADH